MDRAHDAAFIRLQARLVIERIDVRKPAGEEHKDEVLRLSRMMRRSRRGYLGTVDLGSPTERAVQAQAAETAGSATEKGATCGIHGGLRQSKKTNSFADRTTRA